jgi:hypothetical protein
MNAYALPNGLVVDVCEKAVVWIWAMFFAHAKKGAGLAISIEPIDGRSCVRVQSVYAATYRAVVVWLDIQTGEVVFDGSEQEPIRIDIDALPSAYAPGWRANAQRIGELAADEATARWEEIGV